MGLGLGFAAHKENYGTGTLPRRAQKTFATYEFTFFGISVGKTLYGFCEVGVSSKGLVNGGIGFRFNERKDDRS